MVLPRFVSRVATDRPARPRGRRRLALLLPVLAGLVLHAAPAAAQQWARGDDDHDGVPNAADVCLDTPAGTRVDATGCPQSGSMTGTVILLLGLGLTLTGLVGAAYARRRRRRLGAPENLPFLLYRLGLEDQGESAAEPTAQRPQASADLPWSDEFADPGSGRSRRSWSIWLRIAAVGAVVTVVGIVVGVVSLRQGGSGVAPAEAAAEPLRDTTASLDSARFVSTDAPTDSLQVAVRDSSVAAAPGVTADSLSGPGTLMPLRDAAGRVAQQAGSPPGSATDGSAASAGAPTGAAPSSPAGSQAPLPPTGAAPAPSQRHLVIVSGNEQTGVPGRRLSAQVVLRVEDGSGHPVAGATVHLQPRSEGGVFEPAALRSNSQGLVRGSWTLSTGEGIDSALATIAGASNIAPTLLRATARYPDLAIQPRFAPGGTHTCQLSARGRVTCWGDDEDGQLGGGTSGQRGPVVAAAAAPLAVVAAGVNHTCALMVSGQGVCWGANASGQLGDGTHQMRVAPTPVAGGLRFMSIATGAAHTCALDRSGAAYCWGSNANGELGDGTHSDHATPKPVAGGLSLRAIVAGWGHTCALDATGSAYCWGGNAFGQLGDGATTDRSRPAAVAGGVHFRQIDAGSAHTCGVANDGAVFCWGHNAYGQLGTGDTDDRAVPTQVVVGGVRSFTEVALGGVHSCALAGDGTAYCWGRNVYGQLGDGTTTDRSRPVPVTGGLHFTSIQANGAHTCARAANGDEYCWGYNIDGQLGDGTRTNASAPVKVVDAR